MKKILFPLLIICLLPSILFGQSVDIWTKAAYGSLPGISHVFLNGRNGTNTTTFETVWPQSSAYTFLTANMSSPYASAADANDTSAGTGARTFRVTCVDSTFTQAQETVSLNGQTSVPLTINCMTVNKMEVLTVGSGGSNAGAVYIGTGTNTAGVPAVVHGIIATGANLSASMIYAVPDNKSLLCRTPKCDILPTSGAVTECDIKSAENGGPDRVIYNFGGSDALIPVPESGILLFPEKSQIRGRSLSSASTPPSMMSMDCLLIDSSASNLNQGVF